MTLKDAEVLVAEIKEQFPNPQAADGNAVNGYCVGGAYMHTCKCVPDETPTLATYRFPGESSLAKALMRRNEHLNGDTALNYAIRITRANDRKNFDGAYELLLGALTYQGG